MADTTWVDEAIRCRDSECPGSAYPELDGDHRYYACEACGFEFGYSQVRQPDEGGSCAMGISEGARQQLSRPEPGQPVMLQIGRRPSDD